MRGADALLSGEAAHGAEAGEDQRMHARLGAAGKHRVGIASADDLGLAHCVRAGRAGGDRRVVGALEPEEIASWPLAESTRTLGRKCGETRSRSALLQDLVLLHDPEEAADRGTERDADPVRLVLRVQPCVLERLSPRLDREQDIAVEPARLLRRDDLRRLEALDLGRNADRELAGVEGLDEVDPTPHRRARRSMSRACRVRAG